MEFLPNIYIVILNFNSYEETIECINSIHNITYPNYKIVIVDNKSKDESVEVLKDKYPMHHIIESEDNLGYANGNNLGIQYALDKGAEYVCILNNDVVVEKNFLEPLIKLFKEDNNLGMVGPCICEYTDRNTIQAMGANINLYTGLAQGKYKKLNYENIKKTNIEVGYLGGACFIVKKEVFEKIGLIPENYFLFFEETEFCLNAVKNKYKLICVSESKVYHKRSATISKFSGLSYFFLNRNRIVFMRRNANIIQKIIFSMYIILESIGRIALRGESLLLIKYYIEGIKCDKDNIDLKKIKFFLKTTKN